MELDLARLIVRHRHVAPMLSALLTGTNAGVRIRDEAGTVILEREATGIGFEKFPISVEGRTVGWVEGDRTGRSIAAVLSYAVARELDKKSLAREALDRYRELNLVYELADQLSGDLDAEQIGFIVIGHADKMPATGNGFVLMEFWPPQLSAPAKDAQSIERSEVGVGIIGSVASSGIAEAVNNVAGDVRSTEDERRFASMIVAPLIARGHTIGVVGASSAETVTYQSADVKLISAIAAIAGPALSQAQATAQKDQAAWEAAAARGFRPG